MKSPGLAIGHDILGRVIYTVYGVEKPSAGMFNGPNPYMI